MTIQYEPSTPAAFPSAPTWSERYSQQEGSLIEATAVKSFRENKVTHQPSLIHIPSSNVLVGPDSTLPTYGTPTAPVRADDVIRIDISSTPATATSGQSPNHPRLFRGKPVKPKNAHLPDSILAFKHRRQAGTTAVTWVCAVTGLVLLGPLGAGIAGGAAYGVSKSIGKSRERQLVRQHEQQQLQRRVLD